MALAAKDNGGFSTFPYTGSCLSVWPKNNGSPTLDLVGPTVSSDDKTLTFTISSTTATPLNATYCPTQNLYKLQINLRELTSGAG